MLNLTNEQAKSIASLMNVAGDRGDVPELQCVKVVVKDGKLSAHATNRFIIARATFDNWTTTSEDTEIMLTPEVLKFMKTAKHSVGIVADNEWLEVSSYDASTKSKVIDGRYPDVESIVTPLENEDVVPLAEPLRLNLDLVAKVSKLVAVDDGRKSDAMFDIYTKGTKDGFGGKTQVAPIVLKRSNLVVVLQPARRN